MRGSKIPWLSDLPGLELGAENLRIVDAPCGRAASVAISRIGAILLDV